MANIDVFQPSAVKNPTVVVNCNLPIGTAAQVEVYVGPNISTKTVTSGKKSFTAPAANTNSSPITCQITLPAIPAQYHVYVAVYDTNGNMVGNAQYTNDMVIFTATLVGNINWS
jgi:hypothetical protein